MKKPRRQEERGVPHYRRGRIEAKRHQKGVDMNSVMLPTGIGIRLSKARSRLGAFRRSEHGSVTVFGIYLAVLIMMVGGIAVDVMHSEEIRTEVQDVADTAVLAAANLDQTLGPKAVVSDYFNKAGVSKYLKSISVTSSTFSRQVSVQASSTIPTFFMRLEGINHLTTPEAATAVQSIGNVEIALALDNSGSMSEPMYGTGTSKIEGLKGAADSFVDTMYTNSAPGTITMSILPYDSHLDIGNELLSDLKVTSTPDASPRKCVEDSSLDFTTPAISTTATLVRVPYYDPGYTMSLNNLMPDCNSSSNRDSVVFSADPAALKSTIDRMTAGGNTSIDTGVKWAAATLDPSFQPVVDAMISKGQLSSTYAGRPVAYSDSNDMKALIVMSDGENTTRYDLAPAYRTGNSPVWYDAKRSGDAAFSFSNPGGTQYFSLAKHRWRSAPYGNRKGDAGYPNGAVNLTYPQLWAKMSTLYYADYIYGAAYGYGASHNLWNKITTQTDSTTMDNNLQTICTAAKKAGIIIYSIGFQTSTHGAAMLRDCATAPSFYFNAQGTDISTVFAKIATNIQHLRLTQ
ncbi:TadE/TadG family type IV pilus assembly protein [Solirhodobacter olei]|uniref:TadE/TadG family type IV pilus assembly protein n=1 Tax=Solirhodobacter olei TaxID=2493082 RepID=UPI0013E2E64B|nr:TadE/TadG family type IV pilus assembly protein [Solirhodobacter olei]